MEKIKNEAVIKIGGSTFDRGADIVKRVCAEIETLAKKKKFIVTVGGGQLMDVLKDMQEQYDLEHAIYTQSAYQVISINTNITRVQLGKAKNRLIFPRFPLVNGYDSDAQAVMLAEHLKIPTVVFVKDTDGIHNKDPNHHKNTKYFKEINIEYFRKKVNKNGNDGRGGHLIEDNALKAFEDCQHVKEIVILDCKQEMALDKFFKEGVFGSKLIR